MHASFWHKCWERNTLGFHQEEVHPFLTQFLAPLLTESDRHVFVPLCGKSLDMFWLAERMLVSGSELSEIACRDFFNDANITYQTKQILDDKDNQRSGNFTQFYFDSITLWQGDFLKLTPDHVISTNGKSIDWIYDRAALIALPLDMQQAYINHLVSFIDKGTQLFLISIEFPQSEMAGPPFSINQQAIEQLFLTANKNCQIKQLASRELTDKYFAQRKFDVSHLVECLYLIDLS